MNILQLRDAPASLTWPYRTLKRSLLHINNAIFVAEGKQTVSRLLASNIVIDSILTTSEFLNFVEHSLRGGNSESVPILTASKAEIDQVAEMRFSQGLLAAAQIPDSGELHDFIATRDRCTIVALDHVDHAVNVGSIVRNCSAFGVDAVCIQSANSHPYLRRAVRTSLGAVFGLPVFALESLADAIARLPESGFQLIGADPEGELHLHETRFAKRICLVFGNEHSGLSEDVRTLPLQRVSIRMSATIDSLNVASASAIFLHAIYTAGLELPPTSSKRFPD